MLLDLYYTDEAPLTLDDAMSVCRAVSKSEQASVCKVLDRYFEQSEGRWINKRCAEEIAKYHEKSTKNAAIGALGGKQKAKRNASETLSESVSETLDERLANDTPSHKPIANSQEKEKAARVPALTVADLSADGLSENLAVEFLAHRKRKRALLTPRAWSTIKSEAGKAGLSPAAVAERCIARGWVGFEAEWVTGAKPAAAEPPVLTPGQWQ